MAKQQQQELTYQDKFNLVMLGCVSVQRGITIISRKRFGLQSLGKECAICFFLILAWASVSHDEFMYGYLAVWCVCLAKRRNEARKAFDNGEPIHSWSDGETVNLGTDERMARLWYEPACVMILGAFLLWLYPQNGWPVKGLPYFLFLAAICMRVVESFRVKVQERRMMAMNDAKLQQEWMVSEHGDKFGK
jgi:hypothetical protein